MVLPNLAQKVRQFFQPSLPGVACEITRQFFSVVRLNTRNPPAIDRFAVESIPHGWVNPSLTRPIITSTSGLVNVLKSTFAKAEIKTSKISLAIPDACAKVTIHYFDSFPANENEKIQLLKWKLKKTVPFNVDDSHLSYLEQKTDEGKHVVVTANIYKEVLAQLEGLFDSLGIQVGYITLASFAAFELLARLDTEVPQKSVLFLRVRPSDVSSLIVQRGAVVFFRHVDYEGEEASAQDSVETTKSNLPGIYDEIHPCLMYYQDKLGATGIEKIYIAPFHALDPGLLSSISEKSKTPVFSLDPLRLFQWRQSGSLANIKNLLGPALGLALGKF